MSRDHTAAATITPGGKAQKGLLHQGVDLAFQEKDAPRAQRGAKQGEEQP